MRRCIFVISVNKINFLSINTLLLAHFFVSVLFYDEGMKEVRTHVRNN